MISISLRRSWSTLGAKEIINIEPVDGEVRYSPALTHRVGNIGATAFRNITVQIQARDDVSPAGAFLASPKPTGYQAKPALDNELVRVERLILEPGQSTGRYTLPRSGLLIAARDGMISVERPGTSAHQVEMKAGEFEWHTGPTTHTHHNSARRASGHRRRVEISPNRAPVPFQSPPSSHAHARDVFPASEALERALNRPFAAKCGSTPVRGRSMRRSSNFARSR